MQALALAIVTGPFKSLMHPCLQCELRIVTLVPNVKSFAQDVHTSRPGAAITKASLSGTAV